MNKKGFLLFEVLVSIVIVTAALLFITRSYSSSKDAIGMSTEIFKTALLLEEKMWGYEEMGEIREGSESGDFREHEGYSWKVSAESLDPEKIGGSELNITRLKVFEEKKEKKTAYSIWTYLKNKF